MPRPMQVEIYEAYDFLSETGHKKDVLPVLMICPLPDHRPDSLIGNVLWIIIRSVPRPALVGPELLDRPPVFSSYRPYCKPRCLYVYHASSSGHAGHLMIRHEPHHVAIDQLFLLLVRIHQALVAYPVDHPGDAGGDLIDLILCVAREKFLRTS